MSLVDTSEQISIYEGFKIPFNLNNVTIEYLIPNRDDVLFQYRLNESGEWSQWSYVNKTDLINLRHGYHTFYIRAIVGDMPIIYNQISFRIALPWHRTWIAYLLYLIMFFLFGVFDLYTSENITKKAEKKAVNKRAEFFTSAVTKA